SKKGRRGQRTMSYRCYRGCFSLHPINAKGLLGSRESSNCISCAHINITGGQATSFYKEDFVYSKCK
uniref:Uncharacterized protein n=1 Tax=Catagonus wagneri TaxID=51154 RepID=A0A8C3VKB1_9CETA